VIYIIKTILPIGDLATGTGTMIALTTKQKILAIMTILSGNYLCLKKTVGSSGNIVYEKDGILLLAFIKKQKQKQL
jgi:hypothetical protein